MTLDDVTKEKMLEIIKDMYGDFLGVLNSAYCQCEWPDSMDEVEKFLEEIVE